MKKYLMRMVFALGFFTGILNAAEKTSVTTPGKKGNEMVSGDGAPAAPLDQKSQQRLKRAHHLAEKGANTEFLNSPQGIAFKKQMASVDQEINGVYEKYLNIFREGPATEAGKKLHAERARLLRDLRQKQERIEGAYEDLKNNSPVFKAMVEKHLTSELHQLKGKLKAQASAELEGMEVNQ